MCSGLAYSCGDSDGPECRSAGSEDSTDDNDTVGTSHYLIRPYRPQTAIQ